jgi:hypothetical protein
MRRTYAGLVTSSTMTESSTRTPPIAARIVAWDRDGTGISRMSVDLVVRDLVRLP